MPVGLLAFRVPHYLFYTVKPPVSGHPLDQKKWPLKRGVHLWEVKNVVFVCGWEHDQVSAYERYAPTGRIR